MYLATLWLCIKESLFFDWKTHHCSVTVGATLACGTGACATVVAAVLEGRAGRVSFRLEV